MPQSSSDLNANSPTKAFIEEYSRFDQFHGIPDKTLMRLAERKTGLRVPNRWIAIALIVRNPLPIPVPRPEGTVVVKPKTPSAPAKLELVVGAKRKPLPRRAATQTNWLSW